MRSELAMTRSAQTAAVPNQPHVLVVDDDPLIRDLVSDYLGKNDFRVTAVGDGLAMRDVLKDQVVDLLVLDLGLRGEDGMAIARRMRDESEIPMVMLTGRAEEADRVMGLELGADDSLTNGEFSLLVVMLGAPNRILSRDQLLDLSRLHNDEVYNRSIDVQILRLRRKIERDPAEPRYIRTERGAGYVFGVPVETVY